MPIHTSYTPGHPAVLIGTSGQPGTFDDLDSLHKDSLHEAITGAREAYYIKTLAQKLASNVTKSKDIRSLALLTRDSAQELEREWRMVGCISNAPVSTSDPYLPIMPSVTQSSILVQFFPKFRNFYNFI